MQEYKASFKSVFRPLASAFVLAKLLVAGLQWLGWPSHLYKESWLVLVASGGVVVVWAWAAASKLRLLIDDQRISYTGLWGKDEILRVNVKGFRVRFGQLWVESTQPGEPPVRITTLYFPNQAELVDWFHAHFPELDFVEGEAARQSWLNGGRDGKTAAQQHQLLVATSRLVQFLNLLGCLLAMGVFCFPDLPPIFLVTSALIPWVAISILAQPDGLAKFWGRTGSLKSNLWPAIVLPVASLAWRPLLTFNVPEHSSLLFLVLVASLFLSLLLRLSTRSKPFRFSPQLGVFVAIFIYVHAAVIWANCSLDGPPTEVYEAKIAQKPAKIGPLACYPLRLAPWGPQETSEKYWVTEALYHQASPGGQVLVSLQKGWLGIPWLVVAKEP
jgi:hypothetical protein